MLALRWLMSAELCFASAVELTQKIRRREISAVELMETFLDRIDAVNPEVNAICTFIGREQAIRQARIADESGGGASQTRPLHGLPVAVKDLVVTKGIRTTFGSPIYKNFIPNQD